MTDQPKTGKPLNPPPWESFSRDAHPAFKPLDKEEAEKLALAAIAEARQFADGPAAKFMTDKQRFLVDAERRRLHHEASIAGLGGSGLADAITEHSRWLGDVLVELGRYDEAKAVWPGVTEWADQVQQACARDDHEDCGCEREKTTVQKGNQEVEIELDRRFALKLQFDSARGKVVTLYQCSRCGMLNAMLEPPERQANRTMLQRQVEAIASGAKANDPHFVNLTSDAHFLKVG